MTRPDLDALTRYAPAEVGGARGLSPFGTATERFMAERPDAPGRGLGSRLTERLERRVRAYDGPPEVVTLAWELVGLAGDLEPGDQRGLLYLATIALLDLGRGSTRTPVRGEAGRAHLEGILASLVPEPEERDRVLQDVAWVLDRDRARAVLGIGGDARAPLVLDGAHLYLQRMLHLEERLVDGLAARARAPRLAAPADAGAWLEDVRARPALADGHPVPLSEEQQAAVEQALLRRLLVITGGPGTGKTSVVVAIIRALVRSGIAPDEIALAAPTGKAANRMAEAVRAGLAAIGEPAPEDLALLARVPEPATLHRLLGYLPSLETFTHHEHNPLAHRAVIVDESSMIDLGLMERLARAVRPDAHLLLLGDAEQLPSVDAGAVLRDVHGTRAELSVALTHSYRMRADDPAGRAILTAARAVNEGDAAAVLGEGGVLLRASRVADLPEAGATLLATEDVRATARSFVEDWERRLLTDEVRQAGRRAYLFRDGAFRPEDTHHLEALIAALTARKLLCITRNPGFVTGSEAMNRLVHQRRAAEQGLEAPPPFLPGEPVMMLHNDYERRLFNGDQGVVLRVAVEQEAATPMAVFPSERGFEPFSLAQIGARLALAHAMTVHKAQGSEMDHAAVLLPELDLPLLTREILYTAMTRARRSVTVVGHPELLRRGIHRMIERHSGVSEKLAARLRSSGDP